MNIWTILGIEYTTDKAVIVNAYRNKLLTTNPEENQEGFMELRSAYESALKAAGNRSIDFFDDEDYDYEENNSPLTVEWSRKLSVIYSKLSTRLDERVWRELFEYEVCDALDTREDIIFRLVGFLIDNSFIPNKIWKLIDEYFFIEDYKEELSDYYGEEKIDYILEQMDKKDLISFDLLENRDEVNVDYDKYLKKLFDIRRRIYSGQTDGLTAEFEDLRKIGTHHMYEDVFYSQYLILSGKYDEAGSILTLLYKEFPEDSELLRVLAWFYKGKGDYSESKKIYLKFLKTEMWCQGALAELADMCYENAEYEAAAEYYLKALDVKETEEIRRKYNTCAATVIKLYSEIQADNKQKGIWLFCEKRYDEALIYLGKWLEELLAENIRSFALSKAHELLAKSCVQLHYKSKAYFYLDEAIKSDEYVNQAVLYKADLCFKDQEYEVALKCCNAVLAKDKDNIDAHRIKGEILLLQNKCDESLYEWLKLTSLEDNIRDYLRIIKIHYIKRDMVTMTYYLNFLVNNHYKLNVEFYILAAYSRRISDEPHMTMELIDEYIAKCESGEFECTKKDISDLYNTKGKLLYEYKKYDEAIRCLKKAIRYNPNNGEAMLCLADALYFKGGNDKKSIDYYTGGAALVDLSAIQYKRMGIRCFGIKGFGICRALHYFQKSLAVSTALDVYISMGNVYVDDIFLDESLKCYMKVKKYRPHLPEIYSYIANVYRRMNDNEKAVYYYEKALKMDEGRFYRRFIRGYLLSLRCLERFEEARDILLWAIGKEEYKTYSEFYEALVMINLSLGEYEKALEYYDAYCKLRRDSGEYPDYKELRYAALYSLGRSEEALAEINRDSRTDSESFDILSLDYKLTMCGTKGFYEYWKKAVEHYISGGEGVWLNALIEVKFKYQLRIHSYKEIEYNTEELKEAIRKHRGNYEFVRRNYTLKLFNDAMIMIEEGKLESALKAAEAGIKNTKCEHCYYSLCTDCVKAKAIVLELMGRNEEALENYELVQKYEGENLLAAAEVRRLKEKIQNEHLGNFRN